MTTVVAVSSAVGTSELVRRNLRAVYARERIQEVVRALAEDALDPNGRDVSPWADDARFDDDLGHAIDEVTDAAHDLLAERLADLLQAAPPRLAGRLTVSPRFPDQG
jgi:hypothetical protein